MMETIPLNRAARRRADREDERKKQQMLAWRTELDAEIRKVIVERDQLRALGQDMFHALKCYSDESNWAMWPKREDGTVPPPEWVGEGTGPELAQRALAIIDPRGPALNKREPQGGA